MKFTGQVRIPDLDHPGVPATFSIEGVQAEVILEGKESLGRWSLFDVHARRLISAAFQIEADGDEITFIADEPIDFAYRGVEEMAEVWARFKSMNVVRRKLAVSRSRKGTLPSRIGELRAAMEENLGVRADRGPLAGTGTASPAADTSSAHIRAPEAATAPAEAPSKRGVRTPEEEPAIPLVSAAAPSEAPVDAQSPEKGLSPEETKEGARLAAERKAIEEERAQLHQERLKLQEERRELEKLEAERQRLEELHKEAEQREANRVEAFRLEIQRLEQEREELERLEQERQASLREAMEQLEAERGEMQKKTEEQSRRETEDAEKAAELRAKMAELEEERVKREQEEAERVAAAKREMQALEEQQRRLETLEESRDAELAEQEEAPVAAAAASPANTAEEVREPEIADDAEVADEAERVDEPGEVPVTEAVEQPEPEPEPEDEPAAATFVDLAELEEEPPGDEPPTGPKHVRREPEPEPEPELEPEPEPEPAMAGAPKQGGGLMGAVRAAFGRGGREHVHDFVEAPGGIGIARSICRECGYVSISTED